jgi:hypothetical protein
MKTCNRENRESSTSVHNTPMMLMIPIKTEHKLQTF